jgi:hypothetical protein
MVCEPSFYKHTKKKIWFFRPLKKIYNARVWFEDLVSTLKIGFSASIARRVKSPLMSPRWARKTTYNKVILSSVSHITKSSSDANRPK